LRPSDEPSARRIRTHIEWNVLTHIDRARRPDERRDALLHLAAALFFFVNVIARISPGRAPRSAEQVGDPIS